jgi:glycerol kinase
LNWYKLSNKSTLGFLTFKYLEISLMLLGIDLGTGSTKALLLATDGTTIGEASSSYPVHAPHPGWAESEPEIGG